MANEARPKIVVVGSFMMDLVVRAPRRPAKGETLVGTDFGIFPGGKGFNQAVAAARLGADVTMVGRIGQDMFGDLFMEALQAEGIDTRFVIRDAEAGTGVGTPVVDADGDNSIVIIPRANMRLTPEDVDQAADVIRGADVLMLQLEVPIPASQRAAAIASAANTKVLLNPAPAAPMPPEFVALADVIAPNETEATMITGLAVEGEHGPRAVADALRRAGCKAIVVTLGSRGAWVAADSQHLLIPAFEVDVVDTTAAGDAFCAGLAVALAEGRTLQEAARSGNGAGALATTVAGTSPAMPQRAILENFLAQAGETRS
jgi:ribokinase